MSCIKAVVFDLDDTLYPERQYAFSGFSAVAAAFEQHLGDPARVAARMRQIFDTEHRPRVFNTLLDQLGLQGDDELIREMIQTYREHTPKIALHRDADDALKRLHKDCKLGLITDGPVVSQSAKIGALGLQETFDAIVLTEELGPMYRKPHIRAFELIAERLGVRGRQCAYVADNPAKDFIAPNALGWTTIQIRRADGIYRDTVPVPSGAAGCILDTLNQLNTPLI